MKSIITQHRKFEELKLVKNSQIKKEIIEKMERMYDIHAYNGLQNGLIYGLFLDSLAGQIQITTENKPKHYVNKLDDWYVDDRVPFKGHRDGTQVIEDLKVILLKLVKDRPKYKKGDILKIKSSTSSRMLQDRIKENPNLKVVIVDAQKTLNPKIHHYHVVEEGLKPLKKNRFSVWSDDLETLEKKQDACDRCGLPLTGSHVHLLEQICTNCKSDANNQSAQ